LPLKFLSFRYDLRISYHLFFVSANDFCVGFGLRARVSLIISDLRVHNGQPIIGKTCEM